MYVFRLLSAIPLCLLLLNCPILFSLFTPSPLSYSHPFPSLLISFLYLLSGWIKLRNTMTQPCKRWEREETAHCILDTLSYSQVHTLYPYYQPFLTYSLPPYTPFLSSLLSCVPSSTPPSLCAAFFFLSYTLPSSLFSSIPFLSIPSILFTVLHYSTGLACITDMDIESSPLTASLSSESLATLLMLYPETHPCVWTAKVTLAEYLEALDRWVPY